MQMAVLLVGTMTAGVLTVAASSRITAEETEQFHLNVTLRGHAVSRRRGAGRIVTDAGAGVLFDPGQDADILWSDDCSQLCLMIPRETLESEIAALLGRTVSKPLAFTPHLRLDSYAGRLLTPLVQMLGEVRVDQERARKVLTYGHLVLVEHRVQHPHHLPQRNGQVAMHLGDLGVPVQVGQRRNGLEEGGELARGAKHGVDRSMRLPGSRPCGRPGARRCRAGWSPVFAGDD